MPEGSRACSKRRSVEAKMPFSLRYPAKENGPWFGRHGPRDLHEESSAVAAAAAADHAEEGTAAGYSALPEFLTADGADLADEVGAVSFSELPGLLFKAGSSR